MPASQGLAQAQQQQSPILGTHALVSTLAEQSMRRAQASRTSSRSSHAAAQSKLPSQSLLRGTPVDLASRSWSSLLAPLHLSRSSQPSLLLQSSSLQLSLPLALALVPRRCARWCSPASLPLCLRMLALTRAPRWSRHCSPRSLSLSLPLLSPVLASAMRTLCVCISHHTFIAETSLRGMMKWAYDGRPRALRVLF